MTGRSKLAELAREANVDFSEPLATLSFVKARRPLIVNTSHQDEAKRLIRLGERGAARTISIFYRHSSVTSFRYKTEQIEAALFHLAGSSEGSAPVAQCLLDQLRLAHQSHVKRHKSDVPQVPRGLLKYAATHLAGRIDLIHVLAPWADVTELTWALQATVTTRNEELLSLLVHYGADPNQMKGCIKAAILSNDTTLVNILLSGPTPLSKSTFDVCLHSAIESKNLRVLTFLLQSSIVKRPSMWDENSLLWNRDKILELAIETQQFRAVVAVAHHTSSQALTDPSLYDTVLRSGKNDIKEVLSMTQLLLYLDQNRCCDKFWGNNFPPFLDEQSTFDLTILLLSHNVMFSPGALRFAAQRKDVAYFLDISRNNTANGDEVWNLLDQLPVSAQVEAREKALSKLVHSNVLGGAWTQDALLFAVQNKKPFLVTHLLMRQAGVNHNNGEVVKAALHNRDEMVFKLLMTRKLSVAVTKATLDAIWGLPKDQKLCFMSLLLNQGVPPDIMSPFLDEVLCRFDEERDLRLIRLLIDTKAPCSTDSLAILIDHSDFGVLQYMLSAQKSGEDDSEAFVEGPMMFLVKKMPDIQGPRLRDVVFQILDAHISALSKQDTFDLEQYFDLREACRLGPIDGFMMKLFEKHQRLLSRNSRMEASALIIRIQEISLARMFIDSWAAEIDFGGGAIKWQDLSMMIGYLAGYSFEDDRDKSLKLEYMLRRFKLDDIQQDLQADCLEKHIRSLTQIQRTDATWPLYTVLELLRRQFIFDNRHYSCLKMASMHEQPRIMNHLLTGNGSLPAIGGDILRPLLRYRRKGSLEFLIRRGLQPDVAAQAFDYAHRNGLHEVSALLLKRATRHIQDEECACLKGLIQSRKSVYVSTLIQIYKFTTSEIDELWEHLAMQPFELEKHSLAKLLLAHGLSLGLVQKILLRAVHAQDNDMCRLVLDLRAPTSDIAAGVASLHTKYTVTGSDSRYSQKLTMLGPCSLHQALQIAINAANVELCDLLMEHRAPLVLNKSFLLRQAIEKDSVSLLRTIVHHTLPAMKTRILDESLWLGTCLNKPKLCIFLLEEGASPLASGQRALRCAADRGLIKLLELFSLKDLPLYALDSAFGSSQSTVLRTIVPQDQRLRVAEMFLDAGVCDPEVLCAALKNLALEQQSPSPELAAMLITRGASVGEDCLINAWRGKHMELFRLFCQKLEDIDVATSCLSQACNEFYTLSNAEIVMLEVVTRLLEFDIRKTTLNFLLMKALKAAVEGQKRMTLVHLLLSKGAELVSGSGSVLHHACVSGDARTIREVFRHHPDPSFRLAAVDLLCLNESGDPKQDFNSLDLLLDSAETLVQIDSAVLTKWLKQALLHRRSSKFVQTLLKKHNLSGGTLARLLTDSDGISLRDLLIWAIKQPVSVVETDAIASLIQTTLTSDAVVRLKLPSWPSEGVDPAVVMAMAHERPNLVPLLLAHFAPADVSDSEGKSALVIALQKRYSNAAESLFLHSTATNDGSLHAAMCSQYWRLMRWMAERRYSAVHLSPLYKHTTVLEAFLRHDHEEQHIRTLGFTIKLLSEIYKGVDIWIATPSHLSVALNSQRPHELTMALIENMPRWIVNMSEPHLRDNRYYSTLSLIEKDQCPHLKPREKEILIDNLERQGFQRAYYAPEGEQPDDAINIPEQIIQLENDRQRQSAYESKSCAVCLEKPPDHSSFHATINPACDSIHSWKDEIICTDCMSQHIIANIFPDGPNNLAVPDPRCWAQRCNSTFSHLEIKAFIPSPLFTHYDATLLQQTLHSTLSSARCANIIATGGTPVKCHGGAWFDKSDLDELTFFRCPVCEELTCMICNQLYLSHADKPCPVGQASKREEENKVSEELVKRVAKECECGARIQKSDGCDHMTCRRCRREWCYECLVPYARIRAGDNSAHEVTCKHYRPAASTSTSRTRRGRVLLQRL